MVSREIERRIPIAAKLMLVTATPVCNSAADLEALQQKGCKKLAVANDGQAYGAGLAKMISLEASHYGIKVVYSNQIQTTSQDFTSVAQAIILAGGLTDRGSDRGIKIERSVNGRTTTIDAKLSDKIQAGDIVIIRSRMF